MHWPFGSVTHSFITHSKLPLLIVQDHGASNDSDSGEYAERAVTLRPMHGQR
jgi:hypothetical protein